MSVPSSAPTAATKPLDTLDQTEWESLCDGCGKCCLHKLEDDETGRIYYTDVACRQLDVQSARCRNYRLRHYLVKTCVGLTAEVTEQLVWLPPTCAYRLRAEGRPLPAWHPLLTGDPESVHAAGASVRGRAVDERRAGDYMEHLAVWPLEEPEDLTPPAGETSDTGTGRG